MPCEMVQTALVEDRGLELAQKPREKTASAKNIAEYIAFNSELRRIVERWPSLSRTTRQRLAALAENDG